MSETLITGPSRGRLFKIFTDFGPYFRQLKSDENKFFFDCLEICIDVKTEPEKRVFLGWSMVITRSGNQFTYQRFNGLFDLNADWVDAEIDNQQMRLIDLSFNAFIKKLISMLDAETGCKLTPL